MIPLRLNPDLDPDALRPVFAKLGRLHLPDILVADDAQAVAASLKQAPWARTFLVGDKGYRVTHDDYARTPAEVRGQVETAIAEGGRTGFQYDFDNWPLSDDLEAGRRQGGVLAPLEGVWDLLNSAPCLDFIRRLTGDDRPVYCDAQASRYRAGQFLTGHDDELTGRDRLYAFVLNLTPGWRPEWGGLLMFHDTDGHVAEAYTPRFNAINIFRVPAVHSVSQVASFVSAERLAVTGWIRASKPA